MFDVGFSELLVIGVVALLVLGPEKLPRVARTVGALMGRAQRYVNDVKADINREIELDELKKIKNSVTEAAYSIESSVRATVAGFESQAAELNNSISGAGSTSAPAASSPEPSSEALDAADESIRAALAVSDPMGIAPPGAQASLALEDPQLGAPATGTKAG